MHRQVTEYTFNALPDWERRIIGEEGRKLLLESCLFPDIYFDLEGGGYQKARPYTFLIDGIQFHYIPNTPIEPRYKYWKVVTNRHGRPLKLVRITERKNLTWEHIKQGFNFYLSRIIDNLRKGDIKKFAGFLGTFLHVLQDGTTYLHSLEGIDGTDIFLLDRLIDPPEGNLNLLPSFLLCETDAKKICVSSPVLLGTSVGEVTFLLYSRFYQVQSASRKKLLPLLQSIFEGDTEKTENLRSQMISDCVQICADVIHTIFCIAFEKYSRNQVCALKRIYLSDLKPILEPAGLSLPYRFITMVKNYAVDENRNLRPLKLMLEKNGDRKIHTFRKGLGTGCHYEYTLAYDIPANVYKTFSTAVGLHAELGKGGDIKVTILLGGKKMFQRRFNDNHPAEHISIPVKKGGLLELVVTSNKGMSGTRNNIVWGDPVLSK